MPYQIFKRVFIVVIITAVLFSVIFYYSKYKRVERLFERGVLTTGYVTEVYDAFRSDIGFSYYFFYKGKRYKAKDVYKNVSWNITDSVFKKPLPVLCLPEDPGQSKLLLNEAVFKRLGREFPDSLGWLKRY